jgi:hypothetical protein
MKRPDYGFNECRAAAEMSSRISPPQQIFGSRAHPDLQPSAERGRDATWGRALRPTLFVALCAVPCPAWGQAVFSDDMNTGHHLASMLCDECHIAARDQSYPPTRDPPAPSFESIAQRKDVSPESLEHFLKTTHRGLDNPEGMENPGLADFQVKAIVAYILSLRK